MKGNKFDETKNIDDSSSDINSLSESISHHDHVHDPFELTKRII